jgi:hypothetical protein
MQPRRISFEDALSSDALSHAASLAVYRQVTAELTGTPEGRLYWPALRTDSPASREMDTVGTVAEYCRPFWPLITAGYARNSLRLPAQHAGRCSSLELWQQEVLSSKLGRDTDRNV